MKLSKQRLLQIIREEIASLTEGESADRAAKIQDMPKNPNPPADRKKPSKAQLGREKQEDAEAAELYKQDPGSFKEAYQNDENALERMVREEIEEYLSEEDNLAEGWLDGFLRDWKPGKSTGPPKRPGGPLNPNEVEPTGTGSRQERGARNVFDKDSVTEADNSFSKAGKEIEKKGTEGVFTAKAKKAGMGVQEFAHHVLANTDDYPTKTVRQASFAKGAATVARENK